MVEHIFGAKPKIFVLCDYQGRSHIFDRGRY